MGRRRLRALLALFTTALIIASGSNVIHAPYARAGAPIYPDLQTSSPSGLYIDRQQQSDGRANVLLRFDNTIENRGGRLEIVADLSRSRDLYQNVYDRHSGGNLVVNRRMASDLIYHPNHNHFHVSDLASYSLYRKNTSGVYRVTSYKSSKTSFCIMDTRKIMASATSSPEYTTCNARKQGLSAGWGDTYTSSLPDQWIDLGTKMLPDGEYAIHSIADPFNRIKESNDANNLGVRLFTVKNGNIVSGGSQPPYCATKPISVPVGGTVYVVCERLTPGATYSIRWRYESSAPITTAVVDQRGELSASFVMPPSTRGAHYVYITDKQGTSTLRAVVNTLPVLRVSPTSGRVGQAIAYTMAGFAADEKVTLTYQQSSNIYITVATAMADNKGNASGTVVIPSSAAGSHLFSANGERGSQPVTASFTVRPELRLQPTTSQAGGKVRPWLRGFGSRESVTLKIGHAGATLKTVSVSNTGAANPSLGTEFTLPNNLAPGVYQIVATGTKSGVVTTAELTITGVSSSEAPPTPAAEPTATPQPLPTATSTQEPEPSPTATAEPEPIQEPSPTVTSEPEPTQTSAPDPSETPTG